MNLYFLRLTALMTGCSLFLITVIAQTIYQRHAPFYNIAFRGGHEIHTMVVDNGEHIDSTSLPVAKRLTYTTFRLNYDPKWSPDGKWILFARRDDLERSNQTSLLYRMKADGSHVEPLTSGRRYDDQAQWSPDGQWIVFVSGKDYETRDSIYIMRADGSELHPLTQSFNPEWEESPKWSPDGQWIAFRIIKPHIEPYTVYNGNYYLSQMSNLAVIRPDGSDFRLLSDDLTHVTDFAWTLDSRIVGCGISLQTQTLPDGRSVIDPRTKFFFFGQDGVDILEAFQNDSISGLAPSANGQKIAFWYDGNTIRIMEREFFNYQQININWHTLRLLGLYPECVNICPLNWSPDGRWVFMANSSSQFGYTHDALYRISTDGHVAQKLTDSPNAIMDASVKIEARFWHPYKVILGSIVLIVSGLPRDLIQLIAIIFLKMLKLV